MHCFVIRFLTQPSVRVAPFPAWHKMARMKAGNGGIVFPGRRKMIHLSEIFFSFFITENDHDFHIYARIYIRKEKSKFLNE